MESEELKKKKKKTNLAEYKFCEDCGKVFGNAFNLRRHITLTHTKKECPDCSEVFDSKRKKNIFTTVIHKLLFSIFVRKSLPH